MKKNSKIYVAGHSGLVGSALLSALDAAGYKNIIFRTHRELDLTRQSDVEEFFKNECPEYVFLSAAKVGGIQANTAQPADFIYKNLAIETNVIHSSFKIGVKKLLFIGSGAVYPSDAPQPIKEEYLLTAPPDKSNESYAIAKIAGMKMCEAYNKQYGTKFISIMPSNLYGPGDNYHPTHSHVIPGLFRKFTEAKENGSDSVTMWGSGNPRREFLHAGDLADACLFLMKKCDGDYFNIGNGYDISIKELGEMIKDITGFKGKILFDTSMPDGTYRKLLDSSKLFGLGWKPKTDLKGGLKETYSDYLENCDKYRK
jgi:Nucleoside-diphosphate-sugar epimerases